MPGLRRLRDPRRDAELHAGARHPPRADRVRLRDRLRRAVPVLHADLRHALDPRPRAGDRDRSRCVASGSLGLGRVGRRRLAVDRRQPPDPRAAPQREHQDPDVQQPHLRADEGPVLADQRAGQGHEARRRTAVSTTRSTRSRWRSGPERRSSRGRSTPTSKGSPTSSAGPPPTVARHSSRSSRTATSTTTARSTSCATSRTTGSTTWKHGEPAGDTGTSSTTRPTSPRRSRCRASPGGDARSSSRSVSSATSSATRTTSSFRGKIDHAAATSGAGDLYSNSSPPATPWTI